MLAKNLMISFVLSLFATKTEALTAAEVAKFTTTGQIERNTNKVGTVSITTSGSNYVLTSNGIPDHDTGIFPAANSNPNDITEQSFSFEFPQNPTVASEKSCLPMGPIAFATNGIPIFNPYTIELNNAVEGEYAEVFDSCNGHPDQTGTYHYHQDPVCLNTTSEDDKLVGVALDGFPIYGPKSNGKTLTSADLDECNGRFVDGKYRYHITNTFPYVMGCYKGTRGGRAPRGECTLALNDKNGGNMANESKPPALGLIILLCILLKFF